MGTQTHISCSFIEISYNTLTHEYAKLFHFQTLCVVNIQSILPRGWYELKYLVALQLVTFLLNAEVRNQNYYFKKKLRNTFYML